MTETLKAEFSILGDDRRVVGSIQLSRVACPGCEATIRLRIQVGNEAHQNFYFVCSTCGAATRGELRSGEDLELSLIIAGARFLEDLPDVDQGITIATDLPAIVDAADVRPRRVALR